VRGITLNAATTLPAPSTPVHPGIDRIRGSTLFGALLFSDISGWIQLLVITWVLIHGPDAALAVPLFFALRTIPKLAVAPFSGALADRTDRLKLYCVSRLLSIGAAGGLAIAAGGIMPRTGAILGVVAIGAVFAGLDQPARRGLMWDLGGPKRILGAVSLSTAAFHCAASLAPALAVVFVGAFGSTGALYVTVVISSMSAACAWLFLRLHGELPPREHEVVDRRPLCGVQYLLSTPRALLLLMLTGAPGLIGRILAIAIPAIVSSHAHVSLADRAGAGALASAPGAGAFVAAVALAYLGEVSDKSRFAFLCVVAFIASIVLTPVSPHYYGDVALLAMAGACSASFGNVIVSMLHLQVPDHIRGRVFAL
jgi:MFS family permease